MWWIICGLALSLFILIGLMSSSWVIFILMMELTMFIFMFMVYEYKMLSQSTCGIKYFVSQTIGSLSLLSSGLLVVLFKVHSWWISGMLLAGMSMKLGAFPLHFWVVPVTMGLPYTMLGILSVPMKILPLTLLINSSTYIFSGLGMVYMAIGVTSMISGLMSGLGCSKVRELLGASSVAHTGWFYLSAVSGVSMVYFALYSLSVLFVLMMLIKSNYRSVAIGLWSLAGLPPFGVFVGKLLVVLNLCQLEDNLAFLVVALGVAVLSLIYYLRFSFYFYLCTEGHTPSNGVYGLWFFLVSLCMWGIFFIFFYGRVGASFLILLRIILCDDFFRQTMKMLVRYMYFLGYDVV